MLETVWRAVEWLTGSESRVWRSRRFRGLVWAVFSRSGEPAAVADRRRVLREGVAPLRRLWEAP